MNASHLRTVSTTADWVALAALPARTVSILNRTGADLQLRMAGETTATYQITIEDGQSASLPVVKSSAEIEIKGAGVATGVELIIE